MHDQDKKQGMCKIPVKKSQQHCIKKCPNLFLKKYPLNKSDLLLNSVSVDIFTTLLHYLCTKLFLLLLQR